MRYIFLTLIIGLSILILGINVHLHSENYIFAEKKTDIVHQLNFLESELKSNNLGLRMQQFFPEGFVFINSLYGLAWCELAISDNSNDNTLKERAIAEALFAYNEINSARARRTFDSYLIPENGIYYYGWRNYLLSKILTIDTTFTDHELYIETFSFQCETIKNILNETESPYLQSYSGQSWPADMFMAMASLSNHDKIFEPKYKADINMWLDKVSTRLDPETNMIPHSVDFETGKSLQGARGCSMSLILRMLPEIDSAFADEQYKLFETAFVSKTLGLQSIREYPKGKHGAGDVDSGPVIFGVGFAATIVMTGTFSLYGKDDLAENQYKIINAFGFEKAKGEKKSYLFGKLPVADAFIAWGRATGLKDIKYKNPDNRYIRFHVISFFVVSLFWIIYFRESLKNLINTATRKGLEKMH